MEEQARRAAGVLLDELAHGADVVGRDERVLPRERRRVAGVVDDRPEDAAVVVRRHAAHDERVVRRRRRVEAADDPAVVARRIGQVTVPGEVAPSGGPRQRRGRDSRERLLAGLQDRPAQLVEVGADQLPPGHVAPAHRSPRCRVGVRAVHEQLTGLEAERLPHGVEHPVRVGGAAEVAEQRDVEPDEQPGPAVLPCLQGEDGHGQRPVDAVGNVVLCGPPHAGVDAGRRRRVAPRYADQAGECGRHDFEWNRGSHRASGVGNRREGVCRRRSDKATTSAGWLSKPRPAPAGR